ncbi:hypothetical protein F443_23039 [Phytophthora nicotianae P1569]|uniref:Uncharacterized protein n=1 Tax=Phytophthora nicotianae P1569 TaxID=1317065 RepID=V9DUZ2_PHYNI|nr:hypothetical protein F443_23039 [Phytophthora nicotianae P1569]
MYVMPKTRPSMRKMANRVTLYDAVRQYILKKRWRRNLAWVNSVAARLSLNSRAGIVGDGRDTPSRSKLDWRYVNCLLAWKIFTKSVLSPLLLPTPAPITSSIHVAGL